ncbi:hypothetical protein [uncultured Treponema sp.]|nr:hypothetical protein [uncultured Treponema sp.]
MKKKYCFLRRKRMHNGIAGALAKKKLEPTPIDSSFAILSQDMPN